MKLRLPLSLLAIFLLAIFHLPRLAAQKVEIEIHKPGTPLEIDTVDVKGFNKFSLPKLAMANPAAVQPPFYRYLYVFGDGNFLNGVRDSLTRYRFATDAGVPLPGGKFGYFASVYASDIYSGGKPPPNKALSKRDTIIITGFRGRKDTIVVGDGSPIAREWAELDPVADRLATTTTVQSVVPANRYIASQKNAELRPKDKSVIIVSLKSPPSNNPDLLLDGHIFLFYNGKIEWTKSAQQAESSTPTSVAKFGKFEADTALIFNKRTWKIVTDTVATGVTGYKRVLVLSYFDLEPGEERHFFFELTNTADLLDFIDLAGNDVAKVKFLSVITAIDNPQGIVIPPVLTPDQQKILSDNNIYAFVDAQEGTLVPALYNGMIAAGFDTLVSFPFQGSAASYPSTILDLSEVSGNIVAARDPNHTDAYACKCGGVQKIVYDIEFFNDGTAATSNVFVNVKLPPELDINSIADTAYFPVPFGIGKVILEQVAPDEIRFSMTNYSIFPVSEFGYGHEMTIGKIRFSILTKAGVAIEDVPPVQACIRFDDPAAPETCTNFAPVVFVEGAIAVPAIQAILQCENCPWYCKICAKLGIQQTWLCILVLAVLGLLVLLLVWLLKKLF